MREQVCSGFAALHSRAALVPTTVQELMEQRDFLADCPELLAGAAHRAAAAERSIRWLEQGTSAGGAGGRPLRYPRLRPSQEALGVVWEMRAWPSRCRSRLIESFATLLATEKGLMEQLRADRASPSPRKVSDSNY